MVALADRPEVVYQGSGGAIEIPVERYLWPARPARQAKRFELSRVQHRYVAMFSLAPNIARARTEAFWQCRTCGFWPWPIVRRRFGELVLADDGQPIVDDSVWEWFSGMNRRSRLTLVEASKECRKADADIRRSPRAQRIENHGMREQVLSQNVPSKSSASLKTDA